jgi:SAM-dependent methyltransferase
LIYRRRFDAQGSDSLAKLARWIRPGSSVLELGAAAGYFTEHLRSLGCEVDVVEVDETAAREAARHARRTVVEDLDGDRWDVALGDARYDAIVCADVLEHLRDGGRLLRRLHPRLRDGGELVLSVPNVAHSAVIAGLVDDRFDYGGEGLLDPTHLRLYTWRSLDQALRDAGFSPLAWDCTLLDLFDTEFRVRAESWPPALRSMLVERANASVYQWLVRAAPAGVATPRVPVPVVKTQHVPLRLLVAPGDEQLSLDRAIVARLPIGGEETQLEWTWERGVGALRLLLADRVGLIRVRDLTLLDGAEVLWSSTGRADAMALSPYAVRVGSDAFAVVQPDAWIAPVAPAEIIRRADALRATVAWQAGALHAADFAALVAMAAAMRDHAEASTRARDDLVAQLQHAQRARDDELSAHAATREMLAETRGALARRDSDVGSLEHAVAALRAENARLEAALAAQDRIIAYRQSARWWIRLPFFRLQWWWRRVVGR